MGTVKRYVMTLLLITALPIILFSQSVSDSTDDLMDLEIDLDDLFNEEVETEKPAEEKVDLLNDVIGKSDFSLEGSFRFITGYSTGYSYMPWESRVDDGRENLTWGSSRYFPFANLTARVPDDFEGVISYDEQNDDIAPDNINDFSEIDQVYKYPVAEGEYPFEEILSDRWDIDLNIGFYWELLNKKLTLSAEYFYCGEETELDLKSSSYPLMWGHNLAGGFSCKTAGDKVKLFTQLRYNRKEKSGVFIPGVSWETAPHMTLNFVIPTIFGDTEGGYYKENADELDRPVSFSLFCIISGKMTD